MMESLYFSRRLPKSPKISSSNENVNPFLEQNDILCWIDLIERASDIFEEDKLRLMVAKK